MEIEYELTMEDLMAFHRYHGQNAPHPQRGGPVTALFGGLIFVSIVTVALFFLLSGNPTAEWYVGMAPFVVLGGALMLLGLIVYVRLTGRRLLAQALKQGRNTEKFLGWRRLSIDAEAMRNVSEFASSTYRWHGIDKVGATLDHAFVYINTTTAIILPCRAFRDDRAFKDFVDAARSYHRMGGVEGGAPGVEAPTPPGHEADDRIIRGQGDRP